ncbi:NADH dehydrogenase [ubiquinone] 1 alpha subcomplex assembly factor 4 [Python bivittatus]|uniref:NADH dehydrogenase [ubiquinone] 1 alpha subcomplex assembly factor 4 n=1 Tax=Python bivittatus TaxID=176946 RepID=A0A9F2WHM4_PYTBI|nr:NADH dehydrogenase [ubiquinone] 1 alpha subcomplex assembly factor 4 [Python bivittatus]
MWIRLSLFEQPDLRSATRRPQPRSPAPMAGFLRKLDPDARLTPSPARSEVGSRAGAMGARVTRVFSKFNVENRAHREISKKKPVPAPRHPSAAPATPAWSASLQEEIKKKDEKLLTFLKEVYVDSNDPVLQRKKKERNLHKQEDCRPVIDGHFNYLDIQTVPKGKILIEEALTLLSNHQRSPEIWTAEKIAKEYSLELKDVTNLLTFFIPFVMEFLPHKEKKALDSK